MTAPLGEPAQLRYLDGRFEIIRMGDYVRCAISGTPIRLDSLCYWSVAHQEPYATAKIALQAWQKHTKP